MTNKTLRNVLGLTSLSALALAMVGCGGSSSSSPQAASNQAPTNVQIVGPTNLITLHPAFYNLSASDPEGDSITYTTSTAGAVVAGNTLTYTPAAGTATPATISVVATDSKGAAAPVKTLSVQVTPNRAPQFISQATAVQNGVGNTINWTTFQVTAQDPDTDDVQYAVTGTPTFVDNAGAPVTGCAVAVNPATGVISFTGEVPAGKTSVVATFTVQAKDKLPGSSTLLDGTATQVVTLTYNNGNTAPTIVTSSLPNLPLNHYIPVSQDASGFPVQAVDVNPGDVITWSILSSSVPGLTLSNPTGTSTTIVTNAQFVPLTSLANSITITLRATDSFGLYDDATLTITPVADAKPVLNSSTYTETVSGVRFFDKAEVKDQVTGRPRFYYEAIEWIDASDVTTADWTFGYAGYNYVWGESDHIDPLATDLAFSNPFLSGTDVPVKGWTARTLFRDPEGDGIRYQMDARSVYVSSPYWPVGQPFTLTSIDPALPNVLPVLGGVNVPYFWAPDPGEFPSVNADNGTLTWFPVLVEDDFPTFWTDVATWATDNNGNIIWANPSIWSFTVEGLEKIWNPATQTHVLLNDPSQKARIDYVIKVQPNNVPWIGALCTIPNSVSPVLGALLTETWPSTELPVGGGASISTTAYGRPSIQEPESRRYDITAATGFDYSAANTVKPAIWRWLVARAGGTTSQPEDVQIYDPDNTINSGHMDAIHAAMGTPTVPAADTTGNVPALVANTVQFYNPWIDGNVNKGAFAVTWGPNRLQYLIARVTASAAYEFPVEVRDQYQRIADRELGINPIFGTVRYTNARTRNVRDAAAEATAIRRGGTLLASGNPGDPIVAAPLATRYTFSYLPFPGTTGDGSERDYADVLCTDFFAGTGPASGIAELNLPNLAPDLYSVASWITLYATEQAITGFHTGNPLNNETGTFNLPSYAQAYDGTAAASSRSDWKSVGYTWINGQNPTNPVINNQYAVGVYANHEVRAQVIPSNSPFIMSMSVNNASQSYNGNWPFEYQGSTLQVPARPELAWYMPAATVHGWHYGIYQSEIDYQNAVAGRGVDFSEDTLTVDDPANTRLRWTYSWPTQITRVNHEVTTGGANKWIKGDVMQIAVPNMGANARFFFTGDGAHNDTNAAVIRGWGAYGMTTTAGLVDTDLVFGQSTVTTTGATIADNTPFHVPSNSIWVPNNTFIYGAPVLGANIPQHLNLPNRTSFAPGATATQLGFRGFKGYVDNATFATTASVDPAYQFRLVDGTVLGNTNPALINTSTAGDQVYFLWMRQDVEEKTAWAVWDASKIVKDSNNTYTSTGGLTTVPGFSMVDHAINSTLPASYLNDAQVSLSEGALPGQNHASNVVVKTDASLYNANILNARGWARSQWGTMAYNMGYQPAGITNNNVRLVNPMVDTGNAARYNNNTADFRRTSGGPVSFEGGVRDSAIVYAVRKHTDEKGVANAELGLAGIEPGSPVLAQWFNLQLAGDPALGSATVATTTLTDVEAGWPKCYSFYSPFDSNWANVMELKMNFLVGVQYPSAAPVTLWKVPSTLANVFPLGAPVTDPSCTNPEHTINPGNPIVGPVQFLRVTDYIANTTPGTPETTLDLVTSNVTDPVTGAGANALAGNTYIKSRSNLMVHFQANVNNQVLPSGYIVEVYRLTGDTAAGTTLQPTMVANYRVGHLGGKDAIQKVYLPSLHSLTGLEGGVAGAATEAVYVFKVRTVWHKGINFETQPTKQSIPMAYADFVSSPFVTN